MLAEAPFFLLLSAIVDLSLMLEDSVEELQRRKDK